MCGDILLLHKSPSTDGEKKKYITFGREQTPGECTNEKNNQTQWCSASMWSCEAHMSIIPTPLHTEIKELIPQKPVCFGFFFFFRSPSSLFAHMASWGGGCQGWRYLARIITIKEITMQKEQLLPPLPTNHCEREETAIDGERGREKQGRGGETAHVSTIRQLSL